MEYKMWKYLLDRFKKEGYIIDFMATLQYDRIDFFDDTVVVACSDEKILEQLIDEYHLKPAQKRLENFFGGKDE